MIPSFSELSLTALQDYRKESYYLFKNFTETFDYKDFYLFYNSTVTK